jgi:hypothetical protein
MRPFKISLSGGLDVPLPRTIHVEEIVAAKPSLQRLLDALERRYKRLGDKDPKEAAIADMDVLLRAVFMDLGDAYLGGKTKGIKRLFELQQEVFSVYDDVLRAGMKDAKIDFTKVHAKYKEMQTLFDDLAKPATRVADDVSNANTKAAANRVAVEPTKLPEGAVVVPAGIRLKSLEGRRGWTKLPDGTMRAKLKTGTVELRDVNGVLHVTSTAKGKPPVTFKEFDTLPTAYSSKPLSTRTVQAHHGCQDALMTQLFGSPGSKFGYDGQQAPTIWLRDSTGDSPHGIITHGVQNPNLSARSKSPELSYGKIRDWAVADLKAAGASDDSIRAYLKAMDEFFTKNIEPNLTAKGKLHLKGTIKAY